MTAPEDDPLLREAADIFIRLRETPDNPDLISERDTFIARGAAEKNTYETIAKAWDGAGRKPGPNKAAMSAAIAFVFGAVFLLTDHARSIFLADFATSITAQQVTLESGDVAVLDADTSLKEDSTPTSRDVRLYEGAALFDVASDTRPFHVAAGPVSIEVLGTVFDVSRLGGDVAVSVAEGEVRVRVQDQTWDLKAGQMMLWSHVTETGQVSNKIHDTSAFWQEDRLVADGFTFAQVAQVIDRRLRGKVYIPDKALASSRISGTINLAAPEQALEALAATRDAQVVSLGPLGYILRP